MLLRQVKTEKRQRNTVYTWLGFFALLLAIQAILLWMDHHTMFFIGDSESYLTTAIFGWLPTDRSFVYGFFIRLVAVTTKSLTSLVVIQVVLSCVTSVVTAHLLIRYFRIRPWIAFAAAFLTSLEPLHLLYTRYVMTETLALTIFVFYVWLVLQYLEDPRIKWLCLAHSIAVAMISVRFAFIPLVWICVLAIPILAFPAIAAQARLTGAKTTARLALDVVMSVLLLFLFTAAYKHVHGYLQHKPPAYSYDSGYFAMSFVFPILEPGDFADKTLGEQILNHLDFPVTDRRIRAGHRWMEGGAVSRLQKLAPDRIKADAIARQAALHAVIHKPLAFLHLGWQTFTDYFDTAYLQAAIKFAMDDRPLTPKFQKLVTTYFNYPECRSSAFDLQTPTGRYFLHAEHWVQFLLFLPLMWGLLFIFMRDADQRNKSFLMGLISLTFIGVALFLVEGPTPRFLHIPAWLFSLMAGVGINCLIYGQKLCFVRDEISSSRMGVPKRNINPEASLMNLGKLKYNDLVFYGATAVLILALLFIKHKLL